MTLSDTHLVLLSAAAQRDDQLLVRPDKLGQKAADRLAARLRAAGLVEIVAVAAQQPHWAGDEANQWIGLRIARAGLDALGIEPDAHTPQDTRAPTELSQDAVLNAKPPRGSKRALVLALLKRDEGASITAIMDATGWLAHSTRAALTGNAAFVPLMGHFSLPDIKRRLRIVDSTKQINDMVRSRLQREALVLA